MAKALFFCQRGTRQNHFSETDFNTIVKRLTPDNIKLSPLKFIEKGNVALGILNPSNHLKIHGCSLCLGEMINENKEWWKPESELPDGTFALFRTDEDRIEIASDMLATRTIWYFYDNDKFIASTSQRAIIMLLGSFDINKEVFSWYLANGNMGPGNSWDTRIKMLPANSRFVLNRKTWKHKVYRSETVFQKQEFTEDKARDVLNEALKDVFGSLSLDYEKWRLTLSGGVDSRAILLFMKGNRNLKTITWGLKSSLNQKDNDAYIARKLARYFDLEHEYFEMDISSEPIADIINRFIICGEGRIDHVAGYMDGFAVWKKLYDENIQGVLRGDEVFGGLPMSSEFGVLHRYEVCPLDVYSNLEDYAGKGLREIRLPEYLQRREDESLEMWRDRMDQDFYVPAALSALNDLKLSYVEIINPLLFGSVVNQLRKFPDNLRTNKILFKNLVKFMSPDINYALYGANAERSDIFRDTKVKKFLVDEIKSLDAWSLLPEKLIDNTIAGLSKGTNAQIKKSKLTEILKKVIPQKLKDDLRQKIIKHEIDNGILLFRIYLISKMVNLLNEDTRVLRNKN